VTRWLVVGGGTAGCVVASRLSEDEANEVMLLEAGADHGAARVTGDVGPYLGDPSRLWPGTAIVRRAGTSAEPYLQGRGLGGSSLVNAALVVPDPDHPDVEHLVPIEIPERSGAVGEALLRAAPDAHPVSLARRGGVRVTAADAYLRPISSQPNLTVVTETPVDRVRLDGRRAVGAVGVDGREFAADRVVLCAGAIQTPTILLRSGLDVPGIGEGVQDHPAFSIALRLESGAVDPTAPTITAVVDRPGRQITAMNHLPGTADFGALVPGLMTVTSTGRITLPDPAGPPLVELNALAEEADRAGLVAVVVEALELLDHPAMQAVVAEAFVDDHGTPAARLARDEVAVRDWVLANLGGYYHVAASCRMGVVTDEAGAVRSHEGLFLCDASLFPGVPRVNPYLAVVVLAERLVARWRQPN
jgi:choline dehydrogenase-like flavoprotein